MIFTSSTTYKNILLFSTLVILSFRCSTATPLPEQIDKSPFIGIPCAAPCWQGLEIGKSSESEVISTISNLTFIDQDTVNFHRMSMPGLDSSTYAPGLEITADCINPNKQCLMIDVVDDILTEIELVFNYSINVDEAIGYLGQPDFIGYRNLGAEKILCEVNVVWKDKKLILSSKVFEGYYEVEKNCGVVRETGKTKSEITITVARYKSAAAIERLLFIGDKDFFEFTGTISEQ
jgi:hypothetical protein